MNGAIIKTIVTSELGRHRFCVWHDRVQHPDRFQIYR